jgi:nicotinamide riboside transporter PnuC
LFILDRVTVGRETLGELLGRFAKVIGVAWYWINRSKWMKVLLRILVFLQSIVNQGIKMTQSRGVGAEPIAYIGFHAVKFGMWERRQAPWIIWVLINIWVITQLKVPHCNGFW